MARLERKPNRRPRRKKPPESQPINDLLRRKKRGDKMFATRVKNKVGPVQSKKRPAELLSHPTKQINVDGQPGMESLKGLLGIEISFDHLYILEKKLRSGSFGTVWTTKHRLTNDEFAVKVIDRTKLKLKDDQAVHREVEVMRELTTSMSHELFIGLVDFFETPEKFYVVLELARGGDVFDRLAQRSVYTEQDARILGTNLVNAIATMHQLNFVHRDLKPENLLLVEKDNDSCIKVADFGFAKQIQPNEFLTTRCGTPAFVAPEILIGSPYRTTVDMWSCGVILYLLLGGYPPFQGENHKALFRKIRAADYVFHDKYWEHISIHIKQLIAQMLTVDPHSRITAKEALSQNPWLTPVESDSEESIRSYNSTMLTSTLTQLKKFNARRKLKGAMSAVVFATSAKFWDSGTISFMPRETTTIKSQSIKSTKSKFGFFGSKAKGKTLLTGGKSGKTFRDIYHLNTTLRKGTFATIWSGNEIGTGVPHAFKVVQREKLTPKDDAAVMNEVAILQSLRHPHIVPLTDFFEERDYFYMVMEMMDGGDVFDRIVQRTHYSEKNARDLAIALLNAVKYIHERGVAHRDLKPQNLLLARRDDDSYIKVADFGFAKRVHTPKSLTTRCGTPT